MASAAPPGPEDRLDSWKEIAAYLKRGVRTVQRWERSGGLPVHRLDGQGSVFAYKPELDAWWAASRQTVAISEAPNEAAIPQRADRRWHWRTAASLALVILCGFTLTRWATPHRSEFGVLDPIPLTSDLGSEIEPTFSPDGNQVAYAWDGPAQNKWDIYVKTIGSDLPLRLTRDPETNGDPAWSPDGRLIAFRRYFPKQRRTQI